jgi:broad specificity phosphatase PhoE
MAKTVHFIRHGQSTFNQATGTTPWVDPMLFDAPLTAYGAAQAAALRPQAAALGVDIVVTTPFTRAVQTVLGAFPDHVPVVVEALHRERLEASCDVGRAPAALQADFPSLSFDHLPFPWWYSEGGDPYDIVPEPEAVFNARVAGFRRWLAGRPETVLAVVGHGAFLRALTGEGFGNCELRTLRLTAPDAPLEPP